MSRLSDVISRVVDLCRDANGRVDVHTAVVKAAPMLDEDSRAMLVSEALGKRIKASMTSIRREAENAAKSQRSFPFPDLRVNHAIDLDGRYVKLTEEMTEMEFRRVINIRRKQIEDDRAYLKVLESAFAQVEPLWRARPDATFGEVCQILMAEAAA